MMLAGEVIRNFWCNVSFNASFFIQQLTQTPDNKGKNSRLERLSALSQLCFYIWSQNNTRAYLQQLVFTWVWKGWKSFFILLHSKLGDRKKNIRTAACVPVAERGRGSYVAAYFCVQHVYAEVTERCLEEVILRTVFEERAVHCVGSDLKITVSIVVSGAWRWQITKANSKHHHTCS